MAASAATASLVVAWAACTNQLVVSSPGDTAKGGGAGGDDATCAPASTPLSILPRTSNDEFRQFVSDLLGRPVDAARFARWTPLAQVNGFDTMTESRIDPGALDEQLRTAEELAVELIATPTLMEGCPAPTDPPPLCPEHAGYDAVAQFSTEQGRDCWSYLDAAGGALAYSAADQRWFSPGDPGLFLWGAGMHPGIGVDVVRRWTAPSDGAATLTGSFFDADPGGGDGVVVVVRAAGADVYRAVIVNGGAPESMRADLQLRRGDVVDLVVERGGDNAYDSTGVALAVTFTPASPSGGRTWANCAQGVVERVALRAFRRPLRPEERDELRRVFDETAAAAVDAGVVGVFPEALGAALQATLLSPHVTYKPELTPGGFDVAEDGYRVASRLALFFRGSFPDDELLALAASGALADPAVIAAQAERLSAVDAERFVQNFGGQWLDFRDPPPAGDPLTASMQREAHAVFRAVLDERLPPTRLLTPGFTFVDAGLAARYGLVPDASAPVGADGLVRVATDERGGLFTQGLFLTKTATGSDFKRVINRGLYALGRTLCRSMPMLDPATREEINASVGQIDPSTPLGEQMRIHRDTSARCTACHAQMDPLGLALEHFDANGVWRDTYADGSAITNDFAFGDVTMRDPAELSAFVRDSDDFRRCVAEKLLTWGLHRAPLPTERCVVDRLAATDAGLGDVSALHDMGVEAFLASLRLAEAR